MQVASLKALTPFWQHFLQSIFLTQLKKIVLNAEKINQCILLFHTAQTTKIRYSYHFFLKYKHQQC